MREISTVAGPAWAGDYYYGDGRGVNVSLQLAPKSGFVFEWHGCGGCYDRNFGEVSLQNDLVVLHPRFKNSDRGFQGIAAELIPVQLAGRQYLIPPEEIDAFCQAVVESSEPRSTPRGRFLIRRGDVVKPVYRSHIVAPDQFNERFAVALTMAIDKSESSQ